MKSDLVEGWDPSGAAPNIALSGPVTGEQKITTNVNPETIMATSGGQGDVQLGKGTKFTAPDRRSNHPLLEPGKFAKTGKDQAGEMLMDACVKNEKVSVERLLGQNVDPNYPDDEESGPMMEAAAFGHLDICKMLAKGGPTGKMPKVTKLHINWADNDGNTVLSCAKDYGHQHVVEWVLKTFPNAK